MSLRCGDGSYAETLLVRRKGLQVERLVSAKQKINGDATGSVDIQEPPQEPAGRFLLDNRIEDSSFGGCHGEALILRGRRGAGRGDGEGHPADAKRFACVRLDLSARRAARLNDATNADGDGQQAD